MPFDVLDNENVTTIITVILGLYIALLGADIPHFIHNLFDNVIFRIIVLFIIVVSGNKNPSVAIIIAISYVLTLDYIHFQQLKEKIKNNTA